MGLIVDATVPTEQFALGGVFDRATGVEIETVPVAAPGDGDVMPFLWGRASDLEALHRWLEEDASTESVECLSRNDNYSLYRVTWEPRVRSIVSVLFQVRGTLLGARAQEEHWMFRAIFPEHDTVSKTYGNSHENGIDLSIRRVRRVNESPDRGHGRFGLSEKQLEALTAALEKGYYEVPRDVTMEELADDLGISDQALSERLRRANHEILSEVVREPVGPVETSL